MLINPTIAAVDKKLAKNLKIAIIRTNYHTELVDNLETYARRTLITSGVKEKNIRTFAAPGSWELPLLVHKVAGTKKFHAIIAFGVIVKGETHHFELIANEVASALMQLSIDYGIPIAFEILAVYDKKHAEVRAADNDMNKGIEAANAVLQTIQTLKKLST